MILALMTLAARFPEHQRELLMCCARALHLATTVGVVANSATRSRVEPLLSGLTKASQKITFATTAEELVGWYIASDAVPLLAQDADMLLVLSDPTFHSEDRAHVILVEDDAPGLPSTTQTPLCPTLRSGTTFKIAPGTAFMPHRHTRARN